MAQAQSSTRIKPGKQIGKGGEATVYEVANNPNFVLKIYHPNKRPPAEKLQLMVDNPPDDPTRNHKHVSIAWMRRLVKGKNDAPIGYVMPRIIHGIPIHKLYNPKDRRRRYVGFTWKHLHRTAYNLASAVAAIHAKGYIIGDLNESNILVQPTALVSLVDTDSFQVPNPNGATFRCAVSKPEYTAPELQGAQLSQIDRTLEHDSFALAVLLFLILMEGSHPFRGNGDPHDLGMRIRQGLFPYAGKPGALLQPPPMNLPFKALHPELQRLFQRCFLDGHFTPSRRPKDMEWVRALRIAESELSRCPKHRYHYYLRSQPQCTWCERTHLLQGNDPFPERPQVSNVGKQQPLSQQSTQSPSPQRPSASPPPSPSGTAAQAAQSTPMVATNLAQSLQIQAAAQQSASPNPAQWQFVRQKSPGQTAGGAQVAPPSKTLSFRLLIKKTLRIILIVAVLGGLIYGANWWFSRPYVIFEDDFVDNRHNWPQFEDEVRSLKIEYDHYVFEHKRPEGAWSTSRKIPINTSKDFMITATIEKAFGPNIQGYGLLWGREDEDNQYRFLIFGNGVYTYKKRIKGEWYPIIDLTATKLIKTHNDVNVITLEKTGKILKFYVNDEFLTDVDFEPFFGNDLGFVVNCDMKIKIDHLVITQSP